MTAFPVGIFETDAAGRLRTADDIFRALALGGSAATVGSEPWVNVHPGDRLALESEWSQLIARAEPVTATFRVVGREGGQNWIRLDASPQRNDAGQCVGHFGRISDITHEIDQRQLSHRLIGLVEASTDAVLVVDKDGSPTFSNAAARQLFGLVDQHDLVCEQSMRSLLQTLRDQIPREVVKDLVAADWNGELVHRGPDRLTRLLDVTVYVQRAPDGAIDFWAAQIRDITASRELQAELAHQATHDSLTGLPNRTLLLRKLAGALERGAINRQPVGVLFLDLDRLKDVNDNSGHDIGDLLLAAVAQRLASATRPADVIARIGGDEFVVLCEGGVDEQEAVELAERVRHALSGRLVLKDIEVDMTVSIGVALSDPQHLSNTTSSEEAVALLRNADTAMYRAKRRGRSRCELFTHEMMETARKRKQLSVSLEQAIAADEIRVAYQPIVSTHTGRMIGAEALLRWYHPERGLLLPREFVRLAEESGVIIPIGDWVVTQACRDARAWIDAGLVEAAFSVHVNVSGRQMTEPGFVERVISAVLEVDLLPQQLTLDFDEATLHGEQPSTLRALQTLRRFGISIALDSFGTGISSLTALRNSDADVLKLDGTLAATLGNGEGGNDPIIRSIIQLAHALDMTVVAEWVTAPDQLHRLKMLGCDMAQGYLFGEPCEAETFAKTARARRD